MMKYDAILYAIPIPALYSLLCFKIEFTHESHAKKQGKVRTMLFMMRLFFVTD